MLLQTLELLTHSDNMALPRILYYNFKLNRNVNKERHTILKQREKSLRRLLKHAFHHSDFYGKFDFIHPIVIVEFYVRGLEKYQVIKKGNTSYRVEVVSDIPRDMKSGKYNLIREEFGSA